MASTKRTKESPDSVSAPVPEATPSAVAADAPARFPIVGIGASAGGLEAFEAFFRHVPVDCNMAFVVVAHLDPDHVSILTDILQRTTPLKVVEAADQMQVESGHVYVIPPNRDMTIFHGALQLSLPDKPRGQRMVIDAFFRSLAEDLAEAAAGIILSGTGTDGTLGVRAIAGAGGLTLAQEPASAKYDGMPASAIQSGFVTQVLSVERMPEALMTFARILPEREQAIFDAPTVPDSLARAGALSRVLMQLRSGTGHDFSLYKKSTIIRRISRRMAQHGIDDTALYARYLKEHPAELQLLFRELLINVTSFFRDPEAFTILKDEILRPMLSEKSADSVFRVWVAGCASGEEAYSIAMIVRELLDEMQCMFKVQIYGTDLDDDAIRTARAGVYPPNIAADLTPERLKRFFVRDESGYRIKKDVRDMVVFAVQNVIKDPPFTRLHLLSCRNLMIYLEPELQDRLIVAFHYALNPAGVLFLSPCESIGNHTSLFTPLNRKWKLYRANTTNASPRALTASGLPWAALADSTAPNTGERKTREGNFAELMHDTLLQAFAPASVLTDLNGDILFVHGDTGKYLRPAPGQATLSLAGMARPGLQLELFAAMQAAGQSTGYESREVEFNVNDEARRVGITVRALPNADNNERYLLVSFQDLLPVAVTRKTTGRSRGKHAPDEVEGQRIEALERDLAYTREKLQTIIEEQQASNEELKATNEEMQSTNEELQSTNEELETSKEELHSVNEELMTVNAELQAKIEQLTGIQSDMRNLLDNVGPGVVFLDDHLRIRRFTREAARIFRLVATDVGRALVDIKSNLKGDAADTLLGIAHSVLETLVPHEQEMRLSSGAWYQARIQPYRTTDNMIDGVVLTFTEISQRVEAELRGKRAQLLAESIVNSVRDPLLVLTTELKVASASRSFYKTFKVRPEETLGRSIYSLGNEQWNIPALRALLEDVLSRQQAFDDFVVEQAFPGIGHFRMLVSGRRIIGETSQDEMILLTIAAHDAAPGQR